MKESERQAEVVRLWLERPNAEREGIMALLRFHAWLLANRPELMSEGQGDRGYQHLKTDLRDYITPSQGRNVLLTGTIPCFRSTRSNTHK